MTAAPQIADPDTAPRRVLVEPTMALPVFTAALRTTAMTVDDMRPAADIYTQTVADLGIDPDADLAGGNEQASR